MEVKIGVKGGGANLMLPTLPLMAPVRVQLQRSGSSVCREADTDCPAGQTCVGLSDAAMQARFLPTRPY